MTIREAITNAVRDLRRQAVEAMRAGDPVAAGNARNLASWFDQDLGLDDHDMLRFVRTYARYAPIMFEDGKIYDEPGEAWKHSCAVVAHRILREAGIDVPEPDSSWMAALAGQWAKEWGL